MRQQATAIPIVTLAAIFAITTAAAQEKAKTGKLRYLEQPARSLTIHYPDGWNETDRRPALVIFRCNIPEQREHFRQLGMVVIKPQTAPVNSGKLPGMSLEEIAASPKPRDQVADTKSAIRFIRANAPKLGIDPSKIVATGTSGGGDLALQSHLNQSFVHPSDDRSISCSPDGLVLYCPAFDGIDIWFVKSKALLEETRKSAPLFLPHLDKFADTAGPYALPLDHRASLIEEAVSLGKKEKLPPDQVASFQSVLKLFNERDWQLLHPVEDALKMSASRLLTKDTVLPPTLLLIGDRDHLAKPQQAFIDHARKLGHEFDLKLYRGGGHSFMMQPAFEKTSTADVEAFLIKRSFLPVDP